MRFMALQEIKRLLLLIAALMMIRIALYALLAGSLPALPAALCQWDCGWYRSVASLGYQLHPKTAQDATFGQANWAFFPVFPLLERAAQHLLQVSYQAGGIVVSNLCLCLFVLISALYLRLINPAISVNAAAVFLFSFPYSFYYSLPYTEAVYGLLTVAFFWQWARGRAGGGSVFAGLLSGTRVTGVLLTPVIVWRYLTIVVKALRRGDRAGAWQSLGAGVLPIALAPLGLFSFMLYLYVHTGDGLAFLHIQRAWGRSAQNPLTALLNGLRYDDLARFEPRHHESNTFNAFGGLAGLLLAMRLLLNRQYAACWVLATSILIPLTHGLSSLPRYSLAQPLFMVFLFELIWTSRLRPLFWCIVAICTGLQLVLATLWMQGYAFIH